MNITTTIDGTRARISLDGEIDFVALPRVRAATAALPAHVTELLWDLDGATFMDVAGLHLLFDPAPPGSTPRRTTVTGLGPQPMRLLTLAAELNPNVDLTRVIRTPPPATPPCTPPLPRPAR
ncbi:STAS domain-containing protein [Streptomyces sp. NPDC053780]|uniref:STAS domain-containing protein n=1 Tax=unclassified Streptomyces TaxID=2593676 RepID=UPI003417CCA3